jgi:hypothetical protein
MITDSVILSDQQGTSDMPNGEVFLLPPLEVGLHRLAPTLSLLTSSIWTLSIPKTLSGVFRARGAGVWQHDIVDEADASDGFRVDSALNSGQRADRAP